MDASFDSRAFVQQVGEDLVGDFENARRATTSSSVGSAIESATRQRLKGILPNGIEIGEGFVIDSEGRTSRQTDIVLYERDICPVFSVNNDPSTTYYPCEGVIAVGEIKSTLNKKELNDALVKIESIRALKRPFKREESELSPSGFQSTCRSYGVQEQSSILRIFDHEVRCEGDIFCFVLSRKMSNSVRDMYKEPMPTFPDTVMSLDGSLIMPVKHDELLTHGCRMREADEVRLCHTDNAFATLVNLLYDAYAGGVTVPTSAFKTYLSDGFVTQRESWWSK